MPVDAFFWFLPAYVANSGATLSRYLPRVHPVAPELLGEGKTWEGAIAGVVLGYLAGFLISHPGALSLAVGSILGDMVGSYIKRRAGLPRGEDSPLLDQLDFVWGAFLLYPPPPQYAGVIVVITPLLHRAFNLIGYIAGIKREPW